MRLNKFGLFVGVLIAFLTMSIGIVSAYDSFLIVDGWGRPAAPCGEVVNLGTFTIPWNGLGQVLFTGYPEGGQTGVDDDLIVKNSSGTTLTFLHTDHYYEGIPDITSILVPGDNSVSLTVRDYAPFCQMIGSGPIWVYYTEPQSQSPVIEIIDAKMISPNELGIGVNVTYPLDSENKKRIIRFNTDINGVEVSKEFDVTRYTIPGTPWDSKSMYYPMFDPNGNLAVYTPLKINLNDYNVPRLTDDIEFTLKGNASYEGGSYAENTFDVEIPLPVVVLHGYVDIIPKEQSGLPFDIIMKGYPGGKTSAPSSDLSNVLVKTISRDVAYTEGAYKDLSEYLIEYRNYSKEKYWKGGSKKYVTLFDPEDPQVGYSSLSYATPHNIFKDMENIYGLVQQFSYADKINIIGHSTGGLAGRYYASVTSGNKVNKLITVGTPHDGIARFYQQPFGHMTLITYSSKNLFKTVTLEYSDRQDFTEKELMIHVPKTPNILTWFVPRWDAIDQSLYHIQENDPNPYFLNTFNYNYNPSTRYYLIYGIYSDNSGNQYVTPYSVAVNKRIDERWYDYASTLFDKGDNYVYWRSAADLVDTTGQAGADITRKELEITFDHGVILRNDNVQEWILTYLEEKAE